MDGALYMRHPFNVMSKDPAFLFYSSDFLTGVSDLTFEERGQYITLLCMQHQKGRLSKKSISIAVPNATADVLAKFTIDENGLYFNDRLEMEAKKRAEHAEKQRQRAISGWEKRKKRQSRDNTVADAVALPLEDVNENEDRNDNKDGNSLKNPEKTFSQDVENCYNQVLPLFPESLRPRTPKMVESWKDCIEKLNRIDNIPFDYIVYITKAAREDSFWKTTFLSLPKLRSKNKDKLKYIQVFHEKFKPDDKGGRIKQNIKGWED